MHTREFCKPLQRQEVHKIIPVKYYHWNLLFPIFIIRNALKMLLQTLYLFKLGLSAKEIASVFLMSWLLAPPHRVSEWVSSTSALRFVFSENCFILSTLKKLGGKKSAWRSVCCFLSYVVSFGTRRLVKTEESGGCCLRCFNKRLISCLTQKDNFTKG